MRMTIFMLVSMAATLAMYASIAGAQEESLPDLTVDKDGPTVSRGDGFSDYDYTFVVSNVGSASATVPPETLVVVDEMRVLGKAGSAMASFGGGGFFGGPNSSYVINLLGQCEQGVNCTRYLELVNSRGSDVILPGETRPFRVSALFRGAPKVGVIRNCVTVDPDNAISESNESNNTDCIVSPLPRTAP